MTAKKTDTAAAIVEVVEQTAPVVANPFDFTNTDDLPEAIASRVKTQSGTAAAIEWASVVAKGRDFNMNQLNIAQIIAAATRLGITVPTDQTVRGYLNKAVDAGLLSKPSRETYASVAKTGRPKAEAGGLGNGDAVTSAEPGVHIDPLALAVASDDGMPIDPLADM